MSQLGVGLLCVGSVLSGFTIFTLIGFRSLIFILFFLSFVEAHQFLYKYQLGIGFSCVKSILPSYHSFGLIGFCILILIPFSAFCCSASVSLRVFQLQVIFSCAGLVLSSFTILRLIVSSFFWLFFLSAPMLLSLRLYFSFIDINSLVILNNVEWVA